ncbi:GntR family transcriptional regulator [Agromyces soli]|uniref:GntR family transcriptional regulator n=1 Tax=Agromyces soli TaxID=659012 RepID=A0ABY4AV38_9MICO|nr:GntR family transcriptional regulator [Agromyces soli]UOE26704.1 GntR family transcriptional regulator [Agromyces soli]
MTVGPTIHPLESMAVPVDRRSPLPAWAQVERDLRSAIDQGLAVGDRLPTENEIAQIYGVSRITVRQALSALADEGYVERRQGTGTFVADRPRVVQHDFGLTQPWRDRFRAAGDDAQSLLVDVESPEAEPYELSRELSADERRLPRLHLKRVHTVNGDPIGLTDSWLAGRGAEALAGRDLFDVSVSKTLQAAGLVVDHQDHFLEVRSVSSAESALLAAGVDAKVFVDWAVGRSGGELVETSRTVWLGTRVRFHYATDAEGLRQGAPRA